MSGKPYPAGVSEVVALLDQITTLGDEIEELTPKAIRLDAASVERGAKQVALRKLLVEMDVAAEQRGNFGWEARLAWFLLEMHRQVAQRT